MLWNKDAFHKIDLNFIGILVDGNNNNALKIYLLKQLGIEILITMYNCVNIKFFQRLDEYYVICTCIWGFLLP